MVESEPHPELEAADWRVAPTSIRLLDALEADGRPARFVGGCVRDTLAGRQRAAWDLDLCTPEPPAAVLALLDRAGIRAIPTGLAHGTVTAVVDAQPFEITTLRRDAATDGRHAVVAFTHDFRADAARRDFTINAMSCDRAGRLFDYFGGQTDLAAGIVRFVGAPARRIREDYLRVLRFFRFAASFATTPPDAPTRAALTAGARELDRLSGERIRQELVKMLEAADPRRASAWMAELGVWAAVLGRTPELDLLAGLVAVEPAPDPWRRLAAVLRPTTVEVDATAARLRLANAETALLKRLVAVPAMPPAGVDADDLRRALYHWGTAVVVAAGLFGLALEGGTAGAGAAWRARVLAQEVPVLPVAGRDVVAAGVAPGPEVGRVLRRVEAWWLAGGCRADRPRTLAELRAIAAGER